MTCVSVVACQWPRRSLRIYSQTYVQFVCLCSMSSPPGGCLITSASQDTPHTALAGYCCRSLEVKDAMMVRRSTRSKALRTKPGRLRNSVHWTPHPCRRTLPVGDALFPNFLPLDRVPLRPSSTPSAVGSATRWPRGGPSRLPPEASSSRPSVVAAGRTLTRRRLIHNVLQSEASQNAAAAIAQAPFSPPACHGAALPL